MEILKDEITGTLVEKILSETSKFTFRTENPHLAISKALINIAREYEIKGVVFNETVNEFMEIKDVETIIESNMMVIKKRGVIAVIPQIGEMYKVVYQYGNNSSMPVQSGEMDRKFSIPSMFNAAKEMLKHGVRAENIEVFVPFEGFSK